MAQPVDHRVEQAQFGGAADERAPAVGMRDRVFRGSDVRDLSTEVHGIVYHVERTVVRGPYAHRVRQTHRSPEGGPFRDGGQ